MYWDRNSSKLFTVYKEIKISCAKGFKLAMKNGSLIEKMKLYLGHYNRFNNFIVVIQVGHSN